MDVSEEKIKTTITEELTEALRDYNGDGISGLKILNLDTKNKKMIIEFDFNIVEDDNYIGLAFY